MSDLYSNYIGDSKSDIAHYGRKGMKKGMNIFNPDYVPIGEVAKGPMVKKPGFNQNSGSSMNDPRMRKKPGNAPQYGGGLDGSRMHKKPGNAPQSGDGLEGPRMRKKPGNESQGESTVERRRRKLPGFNPNGESHTTGGYASAVARAKLGGRRGRDNEFDRNSDRDSYDRRPTAASADRRSGKKKPTEESGPRAHINRRTATSKRPLWFHDGVGERDNQSGENRTRPTSRGYSNSGRKPRIIPNSEPANTTSTPNRRKKPTSRPESNSRSLGRRTSDEYRNESSRSNFATSGSKGPRTQARVNNASSEYYQEQNSNSRSNRRRRR